VWYVPKYDLCCLLSTFASPLLHWDIKLIQDRTDISTHLQCHQSWQISHWIPLSLLETFTSQILHLSSFSFSLLADPAVDLDMLSWCYCKKKKIVRKEFYCYGEEFGEFVKVTREGSRLEGLLACQKRAGRHLICGSRFTARQLHTCWVFTP